MDNVQTSASSTHAAALSHSTTAQPPHIRAWPLINRLIPWLAALCVAITGFIMITVTPAGHIPDVWAHIYRISGILNDDVFARPVTTNSILHAGEGTVGGCVDRAWLQFSIDHYDGYDPNAVPADFLQQYGNSTAANNTHDKDCIDTPYNNAAVNSPVAYVPQLAAFALGRTAGWNASTTYQLAEVIMLMLYVGCTFAALASLQRWRLPMALLLASPLVTFRYSYAISADTAAQALCFLFTCLLFSCVTTPDGSSTSGSINDVDNRSVPKLGRLAALMIIGVLMAMSKFTFTPLLLLACFTVIPSTRVAYTTHHTGRHITSNHACYSAANTRLARAGIVGAGLAVGFVFLGVWMHLTSWFTTTPGVVSYAAMSEKKRHLFADPLGETGIFSALRAIGHAIVTGQSNLNSRSQTIIILALWAGIAGALILLTVASIHRAFHARMGWLLWGMVAIATGVIVLTYLALWLQYTPIHTIGVNGVQFRYFLPLSGFYVLCLCESVAGLTRTHIHEQIHSQILKHPNR